MPSFSVKINTVRSLNVDVASNISPARCIHEQALSRPILVKIKQ